ncbi:MAG: hypothetical protein E2O74_00660 [Chloroflexi bacterium]|nr:hypothetical protein [Chloroflexota bacterium]MDK1046243.1 hypothetical protein [Anaerolineales bacterium]MCH8338004.1 hypothetical protein [Chloroflexota bacterium]MCH8877987.1 hypothetical protein [Chloroflexota bacterium]MCI0773819.1 hypothetical protein [Chloroflexota bacterium]
MNTKDRVIHDQVSLASAYHFLMAIAYLIGAVAIIVYAILPILSDGSTGLAQKLFLPIIGTLLSLLLVSLYAVTGRDLVKMRNSARMGAVFLALLGIIGGLFGQAGAVALGIGSLAPNWLAVLGLGLGSIATYALTAGVDVVILLFLIKEPVREVFYTYSAPMVAEAWRDNGRQVAKLKAERPSKVTANISTK